VNNHRLKIRFVLARGTYVAVAKMAREGSLGRHMRRTAAALTLFAIAILMGCADCESCKQIPGWDGRYATHDGGSLNRENRGGLPPTPYVPR
jgi:hypothetical protein